MENTWLHKVLADVKKEIPTSVWIYSGFTFEEILTDPEKLRLLEACDVLVDGPFVEAKKNLKLAFRGSENQRILDIPKSLKAHRAIKKERDD